MSPNSCWLDANKVSFVVESPILVSWKTAQKDDSLKAPFFASLTSTFKSAYNIDLRFEEDTDKKTFRKTPNLLLIFVTLNGYRREWDGHIIGAAKNALAAAHPPGTLEKPGLPWMLVLTRRHVVSDISLHRPLDPIQAPSSSPKMYHVPAPFLFIEAESIDGSKDPAYLANFTTPSAAEILMSKLRES